MSSYVLFISEEKLKDSTAINGNVDVEFLLPYIRTAQREIIEGKLGTDLYNKLKTLISGGTISTGANSDYKKFPASKNVQSFYILASNKKIKYFGNFSHDREYLSQIIFY